MRDMVEVPADILPPANAAYGLDQSDGLIWLDHFRRSPFPALDGLRGREYISTRCDRYATVASGARRPVVPPHVFAKREEEIMRRDTTTSTSAVASGGSV